MTAWIDPVGSMPPALFAQSTGAALPSPNTLLLVVLPYTAVAVCALGLLVHCLRRAPAAEPAVPRRRSWGIGVLHLGIMPVLLGHLLGVLLPRQVLGWNADPVRLLVLEATGMAFALLALLGLLAYLWEQRVAPRGRKTLADWLFLLVLLVQIMTGLHVATAVPWGTSWFATSVSPYLWSLLALRPDPARVLDLPLSVKLHVGTAWLLVALLPFTQMVRLLNRQKSVAVDRVPSQ